jgi:cyanophycin synthetase
MVEHRCSEGVRGGFFQRLDEGTWLGHVLEHVALELQTLAHLPVGYGRTRSTGEPGIYRVVIECLDHRFAEICLASALDLILAVVDETSFDVATVLRGLREVADTLCLGPSTQAIVSAAKLRSIPVLRITKGNLVQLGYGKAQQRIWAAETSKTGAVAESIAQDKELTRQLLKTVGVPVPQGRAANNRLDAWAIALEIGLPVVVKPQDANHGRGVSIRLTNQTAVENAFDIASREGSGVLVERYIAGKQYRVLVVGSRTVAVSGGESEQVVADGIHSIDDLVSLANHDPHRGEDSAQPLSTLVIDDISLELLRNQGLERTSIPEAGRSVLIHYNGDLTVDETDRIHPDVAACCVLATDTVGLDVAGIDLIAEDINRPLEAQGGAIIEVNASPGLVMHLKPLSGSPRPVGEAILDHLFPPEKSSRVPLVAIAGSHGRTLVADLIASILTAAKHFVGKATANGLHVGRRCLSTGDATHAFDGRRLLMNPLVDAIVLEIAEIQVLREGLAFDRCDVAVVTNLGEKNLEAPEITDPLLVTKAVRAPVDVVLPTGFAVLYADDPEILAMAEKTRGQVLLYSDQGEHLSISQHLKRGGRAVFMEKNRVVSAKGSEREFILDLDRLKNRTVPPSQIYSLTAAVAAGVALGLESADIVLGIHSHFEQMEPNPGRQGSDAHWRGEYQKKKEPIE